MGMEPVETVSAVQEEEVEELSETIKPPDQPAPEERASPARGLIIPPALQAIAWSTGAAVFVGLATAIGRAHVLGEYSALGLTALDVPTLGEANSVEGAMILLPILLGVIAFSVIGRGIYKAAKRVIRKFTKREGALLPTYIQSRMWWLVIALLITIAGLLNIGMATLARAADNILFKPTTEIGDVWTHIIFEDDHTTATNYALLFTLGLTAFAWLSWWLVTRRFTKLISRITFSTFAAGQIVGMLLAFASLTGIASTVQNYPTVAFSGIEGSEKMFLPILLGQDDKMFAILLLKLNENEEPETRYLLYLPRTQVKWITAVGYIPLYRAEKLGDLKRLAEEVQKGSRDW